MAKVFVSHRKSDADKARLLAQALQAAGHDVWFDEWEIEPGTSIVGLIDQGLEQSQYVIVCYSGDGVGSPWMSREWMSTLARQLSGHNVKILPARLTGALAPPAILADIRYADLVANWDRGLAELLRAIR
ncbi:MAG TPA: toll/interleukin-1 receptor domain-containing protein [Kofleriaceae bacterium]|nr:toll/interleukin-1 receptor domain-containing protein [Kofleriaceae bacterium]